MQYDIKKNIDYIATGQLGQALAFDEVLYTIFSNTNNLSFLSTKGADVGYKNVTVSETGNGSTELEYYSPIDYPEHITYPNIASPFAPTPNFDYKRGLLTDERKYNELGRTLTEKINSYSFENQEKITGFSTYTMPSGNGPLDCPYTKYYNYYYSYRSGVQDPNTYCCVQSTSSQAMLIVGSLLNWNARNCGEYVSDFVSYYPIKEAYGWAKLDNTIIKEYFYDSNGNQSQLNNSISYTYNPNNMQIASQSSSTSTGENIEKKYYYTIDSQVDTEPHITTLRNNNMVETLINIETFKAGVKISEQKTIYNNWGNTLLLPEFIKTTKGSQVLETRVKYNAYDEYGNPLELKQENGTVVSYIWGYNKTQPIAKMENATYASVQSYVAYLQTLSNGTNEANLLTALNALRTALPNAMITTYTYKPLVGISTITDPKGNTQTYHYDAFNRLQLVKDAQENILSGNEYHYRTQN